MKGIMVYRWVFFSLMVVITSCQSPKGNKAENKLLTVFHAGSLAVPMKTLAEGFRQEHPGVEIRLEAAGSLACIRKVTELRQSCDLLALADYDLIDALLIPEYASWNIKFATNELCLVFTDRSYGASDISDANWYKILSDPQVRYGRSDPDSDPCGYRTVLALKLAGMGNPGLNWQSLLKKDTRFIRSKETDLNALLESHTIDYMFNYRSVAVQHGFRNLRLPDSMSLGKPELADWYAKAVIDVRGATPGTTVERKGAAIIYGLTVPKGAPNAALALEFVRFITDPERGGKLISQSGQEVIPAVYSPKSSGGPLEISDRKD